MKKMSTHYITSTVTVNTVQTCLRSATLVITLMMLLVSGNSFARSNVPYSSEGAEQVSDSAVALSADQQITSARYRLTFDATWSEDTHPLNFPGDPHFSGLVGAVHNDQVKFWEPGQYATPGIQLMAERGRHSGLRSEVQTAIDAGDALAVISEGGIKVSPGSVAIEFDVTMTHPEITVTSMLAPSPDWFVGVHNFSLLNNGEFTEYARVELSLYDSGSDDGRRYTSSNEASDPLVHIALVSSEAEDSPFTDGGPSVGSFTFERLAVNTAQ